MSNNPFNNFNSNCQSVGNETEPARNAVTLTFSHVDAQEVSDCLEIVHDAVAHHSKIAFTDNEQFALQQVKELALKLKGGEV